MKIINKLLWVPLIAIAFIVATSIGCEHLNPVEPVISTPTINNGVSIKVFNLSGDPMNITAVKTITLEGGTQTDYYAVPGKYGLKSFYWTFIDNGVTYRDSGQTVSHAFSLTQTGTPEIKLLAIDSNGVSYRDSLFVTVVASLDNLPDIVPISHTANGSGQFVEVIAFKKAKVSFAPGFYNYQGNFYGTWDTTYIPAADTNWLIVNGSLVSPGSNNQGKYFVARITAAPNTYTMGAAKGSTWGLYNSAYCNNQGLITLSILNDGTLTPNIVPTTPGVIGDSVLRQKLQDTLVSVYTNNLVPFASSTPFIVLYDSNGVVSSPIAEKAVTNYANWGTLDIPYSTLTTSKYVVLDMNFGPNIFYPTTYSTNRTSSIYWNPSTQTLRVVLVVINGRVTNILTMKQFNTLKAANKL
jgi:hypothetical protein